MRGRGGRGHGLLSRTAVWLAAGLALYLVVTFVQVGAAAMRDEARETEAIVVLGAAQYDGRPSPVLRSRLDHAAWLYDRGYAPIVVLTGGGQPGDRYSEARAAAEYLYTRGVPDEAQRREVEGHSSWESLAATARFLRQEGIDQVLLVSDPWHSYRIAAIAEDEGLMAYTSPSPTSPFTTRATVERIVHETGAVAVGRVVGYRRLSYWQQALTG